MELLHHLVAVAPSPEGQFAEAEPFKKKHLSRYKLAKIVGHRGEMVTPAKIGAGQHCVALHGHPGLDHVPSYKRKDPGKSLTAADLQRFDESLISSTTAPVQQSHCRKNATILRFEGGSSSLTLTDAELLQRGAQNPLAVTKVAAALAEQQVSSSSNYFSSWAARSRFSSAADHLRLRYMKKVGRLFGGPGRGQAEEINLHRLAESKHLFSPAPLHLNNAVAPYLTVLVNSSIMLRGIAGRSMHRHQVIEKDEELIFLFGFRKGTRSNRRRALRELPLVCRCPHCPKCWAQTFLKIRDDIVGIEPSGYLFCSQAGAQLSKKAWASMIKSVGLSLGHNHVTPHSARVSGARHWAGLGLSEALIASMGDWKSIATLRRYIGAALASKHMLVELQEFQSRHAPQEKLQMPPWKIAEQIAKALAIAKPSPFEGGLAMVSKRYKKWHRLGTVVGPSRYWHSLCGVVYNPATMDLQAWGEFGGEDHKCRVCSA